MRRRGTSSRMRLDDRATPAGTDELDAGVLDGQVVRNIGKDAMQEGVRGLVRVVADVVVGTDLGCGGHELDRESASVSSGDRVHWLGAMRGIRVQQERLRRQRELIKRGLRSVIRDVGAVVTFELAVARGVSV